MIALITKAMCLKLLAGLEANRFPRRNGDLFACAGVAAYAALSGFDDEDAEAAQLDALAARQGLFHRMKKGIHGLFGLHLGNAGALGHTVYNVEFDHDLQGLRHSFALVREPGLNPRALAADKSDDREPRKRLSSLTGAAPPALRFVDKARGARLTSSRNDNGAKYE